ncbi:MAG TPA: hypothetical protein VN456_14730 [Desulfosporosinus sp.]|nr:hypothetical protein [Desulfosporosinus sp.]
MVLIQHSPKVIQPPLILPTMENEILLFRKELQPIKRTSILRILFPAVRSHTMIRKMERLDMFTTALELTPMETVDKNTWVNSSVNFRDGEAVPWYIDSGVYNKAGVFLKDQSYVDDQVMDDVFVSLDPADDDGDGTLECASGSEC